MNFIPQIQHMESGGSSFGIVPASLTVLGVRMEFKKILMISGFLFLGTSAVYAAPDAAPTDSPKTTATRKKAKRVQKKAAPSAATVNGQSTSAAGTTTTVVAPSPASPPAAASTWSGFLLVSRSTSLFDFQDGTKSEGIDYTFRLAAKLSQNYTAKLTAIYSDDLRDKEDGLFQDTILSLSKNPFPLTSYFLVSPSIGVGLPTSKASQDANLEASPKLGLTTLVNPDKLFPGFRTMLVLLYTKNLHTYETAKNGAVNQSYNIMQDFSFGYDWKDFSFTVDLVHANSWSYQNVMRDMFVATEEIGWDVHKNLGLAIGHTNGGSTLKADGVSSNVELFN